jgi:hypothetical protein
MAAIALLILFVGLPVGAVFGGVDSRHLLRGGRFRDDIASPD